jgi:S1-C subfamily serine protease
MEYVFLIMIAGVAAAFVLQGRSTLKDKKALLMVKTQVLAKAPEAYFELGKIAEESGDSDEALLHYRKSSELGFGAASHALGEIQFRRGALNKYFEYELKAAEQGYEPAMRNLAGAYKQGQGTLKNIGKSTYWLLRSAENGNAESMTKVAMAYVEGYGVAENPMEGLAWLYVAEFSKNDKAAALIKSAEAKLNNSLILMAQDRAKVIIDLIKEGRRTSDSTLSGSLPASTPGQPAPSKPKHESKGSGSGAVVSSAGHVVTAAHVIKGATYLEVVTPAGTHPATVLSVDDANDVALLKVDQSFGAHIPVGRSSEVRLGQSVATIGFPNIGIQGHSPKVTQGMISGENGVQNDIRMWQISVPIQPGNSGGPLLDEHGRLVGVVVASLSLRAIQITGSVPQNVNYAIKGAYLEPLLNFHKVPVVLAASAAPGSFQDMVATAQKASVLVLVY